VNLNPAPSKTTKERAPANSKAGAPGKLLAEVRIRQLKMPRSLYLVSRRGARLSHAAVGLMRLLNA
jgi:hypothetical protein